MLKTRNEEIGKALQFHQKSFGELNLQNPFFTLKTPYATRELTGDHIHLFESELRKGSDIYIEMVDGSYNPLSIERVLYRWVFNPHWEEEYHTARIRGALRIFIPCDELQIVARNGSAKDYSTTKSNAYSTTYTELPNKNKEEEINIPLQNIAIPDMELRDFAAIMLKTPVSNKAWLNEAIIQSKK